MFVRNKKKQFDFKALHVVKEAYTQPEYYFRNRKKSAR